MTARNQDVVVVRRSVEWVGGRISLITFDHTHPVSYETIYQGYGGLFVLQGHAVSSNRRVDGQVAPRGPVRAGEIDFFRVGSRLTGQIAGKLELLSLFIDPTFLHNVGNAHALDHAHAPCLTGSSDFLTRALAQELSCHLKYSSRIEPLVADGAACLMTTRLMQLLSRSDSANRSAGELSAYRLRMVLEHIDSNLGRDITLSELAACAELSAARFCHAFRNSTGLSPHRYLIARRIERAKVMLCGKSADITEIALRLGFNSQSHFTAAFRTATGLTPMRYMKQNR